MPAIAGVIGAAITALAGRISRAEKTQITKAKGFRANSTGANGANGNGGLVREILTDRARVDREYQDTLDELHAAHTAERAADSAEAERFRQMSAARSAEQTATIRSLRRRLNQCEQQRDALIRGRRGDGREAGPPTG